MPKLKKCSYLNCAENSAEKPSHNFFLFPGNEERAHLWIDLCGNNNLRSLS